MISDLSLYLENNFGHVRVITDKFTNKEWFCASDLCRVLGYKKVSNAILRHVHPEHVDKWPTATKGGAQDLLYVDEPGLYSLIMGSKLPAAERFQDWVCNDVLPSIRKHGVYVTDDTLNKMLYEPDYIIAIATKIKQENNSTVSTLPSQQSIWLSDSDVTEIKD